MSATASANTTPKIQIIATLHQLLKGMGDFYIGLKPFPSATISSNLHNFPINTHRVINEQDVLQVLHHRDTAPTTTTMSALTQSQCTTAAAADSSRRHYDQTSTQTPYQIFRSTTAVAKEEDTYTCDDDDDRLTRARGDCGNNGNGRFAIHDDIGGGVAACSRDGIQDDEDVVEEEEAEEDEDGLGDVDIDQDKNNDKEKMFSPSPQTHSHSGNNGASLSTMLLSPNSIEIRNNARKLLLPHSRKKKKRYSLLPTMNSMPLMPLLGTTIGNGNNSAANIRNNNNNQGGNENVHTKQGKTVNPKHHHNNGALLFTSEQRSALHSLRSEFTLQNDIDSDLQEIKAAAQTIANTVSTTANKAVEAGGEAFEALSGGVWNVMSSGMGVMGFGSSGNGNSVE